MCPYQGCDWIISGLRLLRRQYIMSNDKKPDIQTEWLHRENTRLVEATERIAEIVARIRLDLCDGKNVELDQQMLKAEHQINSHLAMVEVCLGRIRNANPDCWHQIKRELDDSWENLAHAVRNIVARASGQR